MASNNPPAADNSALKTSIPSVHASSSPGGQPSNASTRSPSQKKSPDPRHLAIALHHARNIQARKDTEATILSHIESLIDFPMSDGADAFTPSPEDVATFKSSLLPFQPSDYDNLILERNIDGRCGYALCGKEHRKEDPKAKMRILWGPKGSGPGGRGKEMKIVPKEKLEMWCSDECAERAMYIRVQLNETPAWERTDRENVDVKLLGEARQSHEEHDTDTEGVERQLGNLAIAEQHAQDEPSIAKAADRLAFERGDRAHGQNPDATPADVSVVEKRRDPAQPAMPRLDSRTSRGGSIEGFYPKIICAEAGTEDEDILPCI